MKTLFISQGMRDKTKKEIMKEREEAIKKVEEKIGENVYPIMNYLDVKPDEDRNTALWCLAISLEKMSYADMCYFASDWENYRGCRIEHECAEKYGVKIIESGEKKEKLYSAEEMQEVIEKLENSRQELSEQYAELKEDYDMLLDAHEECEADYKGLVHDNDRMHEDYDKLLAKSRSLDKLLSKMAEGTSVMLELVNDWAKDAEEMAK